MSAPAQPQTETVSAPRPDTRPDADAPRQDTPRQMRRQHIQTPTPRVRTPHAQTRHHPHRPRHRKGEAKAKPGKLSWIHGTKKTFFARRKEDWLREADANHLEFDIEDPPDSTAEEVVHEVSSEEEQAFRTAYMKTLRTRLGNWYREQYGSLLKSDKAAFKELFTGVLDSAPAKPQRGRIHHFYSRKFYETRIKDHVEARMESLTRRAALSGEPLPKKIDVTAKKDCELAMEREYQQALKGWEASLSDSPQEAQKRLQQLSKTPGTTSSLSSMRFRSGSACVPRYCWRAPMGCAEGGLLCKDDIFSVNAGKTKGLAPVDWPAYDLGRFLPGGEYYVRLRSSMLYNDREDGRVVGIGERGRTAFWKWINTSMAAEPPTPSLSSSQGSAAAAATAMGGEGARGDGNEGTDGDGRARGNNDGEGAQGGEHTTAKRTWTREAVKTVKAPTAKGTRTREGSEERIDGVPKETYDAEWQRDDRADWTKELGRAHAAFEVGRSWGVEWVQWTLPPALGGLLGRREGSRHDGGPVGRAVLEVVAEPAAQGAPAAGQWGIVAAREGGLEQDGADVRQQWHPAGDGGVGVVGGGGDQAREGRIVEEWQVAVRDMTWVLEQLLESGEIESKHAEWWDNEEEASLKRKPSKNREQEQGWEKTQITDQRNRRKTAGDDEDDINGDGGDKQDSQPTRGRGGRNQPRPRLLDGPVAFAGMIQRKEVVA
ncbi:hypothetical protein B0H14DRAFT_3635393 [Mycena olivaceomarginata]|nr:hypothetical protein B0H14DRAFT_3635393 [Mycena olivaceomarginata]